MATKGMPRQTLATMTDQRAFQGVPRKSMKWSMSPSFVQRPRDDRKLRIVDPPEGDRRQHGRHDIGQQHDGADEGFERDGVVEEQRQPQPEREFRDRRGDGVDKRVEDREPEHAVIEQRDVVFETDEHAGPADADIGKSHPDPETERIGEKEQQDRGCREHEQRRQHRAVVEHLRKRARIPSPLRPLRGRVREGGMGGPTPLRLVRPYSNARRASALPPRLLPASCRPKRPAPPC